MTVVDKRSQAWQSWCEDVPFEYREADLDGVDTATAAACLDWIASLIDTPSVMHGPHTVGQNLLVTGPFGAGKTWAGFATAKQLRWVGHPHPCLEAEIGLPSDPPERWAKGRTSCRYWSEVTLLSQLRRDETQAWSLLRTTSVPFLDDIGSMRSTEWVLDQLYGVLDFCSTAGKPVIATTNLQLPELKDYLGGAAYSRLVTGAKVIELLDVDRRKGQS